MKVNGLTGALGLGFLLTGLFAFLLPEVFFNLLPDYYGQINIHFIKDAGISFFSSGTLLLLSLVVKKWQIPFAIGGALFVFLHALFHIQMLLGGMAPTLLDKVIEITVIVSPGLLSGLVVGIRLNESRITTSDIH